MRRIKKIKHFLLWFVVLISIPAGVYLVSQKTSFFKEAFGTNADIYIDAIRVKPTISDSWRNLAQGGEENKRQLEGITSQISQLKPEYIRIDHIYDYFDIVKSDGSYNFSRLDQEIFDIRKTGAKPFLALSYMPKEIANGDITGVPSDWSAWEKLVQATVEHVSGRGGLAIPNVYYEVWNEPDLFGGFKIYGRKNYLDLYAHSAIGASRARNVLEFKLGGPATTAAYQNWNKALINLAQSNGYKLDFISWHRYSFEISDLGDLSNLSNLETIISESGPDSKNNPAYDNYLGAIHLIGLTALINDKISKNFTFEIKDGKGPQKYWGRWGLLTHEAYGVPETKPRYSALKFLNNLIGGDNLEVSGEGTWVKAIAKNYGKKIAVLVVNYDQFGRHNEIVPIKIENLPGTKFKLTRLNFNGQTTETALELPNPIWESTLQLNPNTASIFIFDFE